MVFGEGSQQTGLVLVGEQPGDVEDKMGRPFVGPAGKILDNAMEEVGLPRPQIYITNAVKHFKFVPRGKRRLHQSPTADEIDICKWWLQREIDIISPKVIVLLGTTAIRAVLGKKLPISRNRGKVFDLGPATNAIVTIHPSFVLRQPDGERRAFYHKQLVEDLRLARQQLG